MSHHRLDLGFSLSRIAVALFLIATGAANLAIAADEAPKTQLPKVILLGDSIRGSYASVVANQLAGRAEIISHKANGGDSSNELKNLTEWAIRLQPAVVHFNAGIHDTKKSKATGQFQVPPDKYEQNLREIVKRLRAETKATVLFALTTPILDDRAAKARPKAEYELSDQSVQQYNQIARRVMKELQVPVDDLRAALGGPDDWSRLMNSDGVHFGAEGAKKLGHAVADFVGQYLPAKH